MAADDIMQFEEVSIPKWSDYKLIDAMITEPEGGFNSKMV